MLSITRIAVLVAALLGAVALASKPADHRTCEQTNFCARNRNRAPVGTVATNAEHTHKGLHFDLTNPNAPAGTEPAPLRARVSLIGDHTLQFTVEEDTLVTDAKGARYEAAYVIRSEYAPEPEYLEVRETPEGMVACAKTDKPTTNCVSLELNPFKITHLYNDRVASVINGESLFNFEQHRDRLPTDSDAMWAETWNGWTDVKPRGPASLSLDVTFPSADVLYGLPSDSRKLALDVTRGPSVPTRDPYRLYNLPPTSTAYSTNSSGADSCGSDSRASAETAPRPSSGSVPYVVGYGSGGSDVSIATGMLFVNPSEMFVDVYAGEGDKGRTTHWIAETGSMHVYLYVHDEPKLIQQLLSQTVGLPAMPPIFALGYHQSYNSYTHQEPLLDTLEVIRRNEFPCESFWLDHGSNEESRSFTWHPSGFYDPALFQLDVSRRGMHVVTAVSPHIAAIPGFAFYDAIADKTAFVDGPEDAPFEGKTIAGVSSWPNFARHIAREQWSRFFAPRLYKETSMYLHAWSDRNEPEVLDGPEQTMPKGVMHGKGRGEYLLEHREIHNMHGLFSAESSFVGIYLRQLANVGLPKKFVHPFAPEGHYPITPVAGYAVESQRPFLLTRSFFAGSHRFGAIALGGASASWETYRSSIGSLLSLSVVGMPFVGADVGGYTGSLSNELAERWFQMAAFTPFMRVHRDGSKGGSALEPWSYANATGTRIRAALRRRYDHMAYLYTLARVANTTGLPLMRPLVYEFPADAATLSLDSQFMLGEAIMVAPVSQAGHTSVNVYIPNDTAGKRSVWYDLRTLKRVPAPDAKGFSPVKAPADYTPVLYRAGHIIPKQPTQKFQKIPHLTTAYQSTAPYEFVVALTNDLRAQGNLYLDDGSSYDFFMRNYFYMQYTIAPESGEDDKKAAIPARLVIDGSRITLPSILPLEDPNPLVAAGTLLESFVILGIPENIRATKAYITRKGEQYPFDGFIEMDLATVTVRIPSGSTFIVGTEFTMTIELEERPVYGPVDSHSTDSSSAGPEDTTFAAAIKAVDGLSSAPVAVSSDAAAAAVATAVASLERTGLRRRLGLSMN